MTDAFWLSDAQWMRLKPLLPNKPRGVPRVDGRRVISGIVHVLQSGAVGGRMRRASTARPRRSTTGAFAGQRRACGGMFSRRWRPQAAPRPRC